MTRKKLKFIFVGIIFLVLVLNAPLAFAMKNPSAVYCNAMGYQYGVLHRGYGDIGYCVMPTNQRVSAWEFLVGTVGDEYSYCTQKGYKMKTVKDPKKCGAILNPICAVCVLEDGSEVEVTTLMDLDFGEDIPEEYDEQYEKCSEEGCDEIIEPTKPDPSIENKVSNVKSDYQKVVEKNNFDRFISGILDYLNIRAWNDFLGLK